VLYLLNTMLIQYSSIVQNGTCMLEFSNINIDLEVVGTYREHNKSIQ